MTRITSNMTCACTPKFINRLFFLTTIALIVMTGMRAPDFAEATVKHLIKKMLYDKAGEYFFDFGKSKDKREFMDKFESAGRKLKIFATALSATGNVERAFRGTVGIAWPWSASYAGLTDGSARRRRRRHARGKKNNPTMKCPTACGTC